MQFPGVCYPGFYVYPEMGNSIQQPTHNSLLDCTQLCELVCMFATLANIHLSEKFLEYVAAPTWSQTVFASALLQASNRFLRGSHAIREISSRLVTVSSASPRRRCETNSHNSIFSTLAPSSRELRQREALQNPLPKYASRGPAQPDTKLRG